MRTCPNPIACKTTCNDVCQHSRRNQHLQSVRTRSHMAKMRECVLGLGGYECEYCGMCAVQDTIFAQFRSLFLLFSPYWFHKPFGVSGIMYLWDELVVIQFNWTISMYVSIYTNIPYMDACECACVCVLLSMVEQNQSPHDYGVSFEIIFRFMSLFQFHHNFDFLFQLTSTLPFSFLNKR